jgi:photosystem II stability/assembly factor-like uncharacterized protein
MTPEERETSAQRLPASWLAQAVAVGAVVAIILGIAGVLVVSRGSHQVAHHGPASVSRLSTLASASALASPKASPVGAPEDPYAFPYNVPTRTLLSAPSSGVLWSLTDGGGLYRSTDRGNIWERRPALPTNPAAEFTFVDAQRGWYLTNGPDSWCHESQIWHTNDAGATWQKVAVESWTPPYAWNGNRDYQCREGLSFIDAQHGFVSAWEVNHQPTIYRTADGGKTWSGIALPDPPDFRTLDGTPGHYLRVRPVKAFGDTLYVMAWGTQPNSPRNRQYVFRSTDGGTTWSFLTSIPSMYVVMVTESRWLMVIAPGRSMESTNGGRQWHPYASDFITDVAAGPQVVFAESQVGYAEGRSALQRTLDGGLHWTRIAAPGGRPPEAGLLPITDPGFTCRLAVISGSSPYPSIGGFVSVPRGTFEQDPAASMVAVKGQVWGVETSTKPVLKGHAYGPNWGLSFDAPYSRWLPSFPEPVSSDGSQYAWMEDSNGMRNRLHVTRVADGSDTVFEVGSPQDPDLHGFWRSYVLATTKDSVLLTYGPGEGSYGVFRLDMASGSLTKVSGQAKPVGYSPGAAWLVPLRGTPAGGTVGPGGGNTLVRLDLASGAVVDWFHRDDASVRYLGSDASGNPWVDTQAAVWRLRGPGQADLILSGQQFWRVTNDSHGTWFANDTGVYLYAGNHLQRVSSARVGTAVGPCV